MEVNVETFVRPKPILPNDLQGHSEELWALSTHPSEHTFVTAGYDQSVCKWSAVSHKLLWKTVVDVSNQKYYIHIKVK